MAGSVPGSNLQILPEEGYSNRKTAAEMLGKKTGKASANMVYKMRAAQLGHNSSSSRLRLTEKFGEFVSPKPSCLCVCDSGG